MVRVRASSWGRLFDCAYSWEGQNLLGMRSKSGGRAVLGTAIHAGTAAFDAARVNREPISIDDATGVFVDSLHKKDEYTDWKSCDISVRDAESIGIRLINRYCYEWSPRYEFAAVELTTKPLVINVDGQLIELAGTLDRTRLVHYSTGAGISDVKSGRAAVSNGKAVTKGHAAQVGTYEILYEHTTGEQITEPGEIIGLQTSKDAVIAVDYISGAKQMMLGTEDHKGLIQVGAEMIKAGLFPPNPQSKICDPRYCARWASCPYHL